MKLVMRVVCFLAVGLLSLFVATAASRAEELLSYEKEVRPQLMEYCGDCHSPLDPDNPVKFLQAESVGEISEMRSLWKSVAEQLRNRTMPPPDETQPTEQERLEVSEWIDETLRRTACEQGAYAGTVTTRRLNRVEYTNTIRDLVGVQTDAAVKFPVDGSGGEGFNNNGETLFLPPILLERYLEAADDILNRAVPSEPINLQLSGAEMSPSLKDSKTKDRLLEPKKAVRALPRIYSAGRHAVVIEVTAENDDSRLAMLVDGLPAEKFDVSKKESLQTIKTEVTLEKGFHAIELRCAGEKPVKILSFRLRKSRTKLDGEEKVMFEQLVGVPRGEEPAKRHQTAREAMKKFLFRAYRRPVEDAEVDKFMTLYDRATERGDPHAEALKLAYKGILVSSPFLFRVESEPSSKEPQPIDDFELASRLSYFLWGSMPDEELFKLAQAGRLNDEAELRAQVDRMLEDWRSRYFVEEFVGQWLGTREVGARVVPDTGKFKGEFSTELLLGFREEPLQLFSYLLEEDRSLMELVTADYVIVNKRLRKHYGIDPDGESMKQSWPWSPNPELSDDGPFEKVAVTNGQRGGLLGMGGIHLLTSYPRRTSPVLRGGWILETLLGVRVPNPPPDIPDLSKSKKKDMTVRESLAVHRDHPSCSACHQLIDPPGFALDHYDVLGRWREKQDGADVNAKATFPDGESVEGLPGLQTVIASRREEFTRHLTRKMLGFSLGRSLHDRDDCVINQITDQLMDEDDSLRSLIKAVVVSTPFRMRQRVASEE